MRPRPFALVAPLLLALGVAPLVGCEQRLVVLDPRSEVEAGGPTEDASQPPGSGETVVEADALAVGAASSCYVATGLLHCFGANDTGQLGLGDVIDRSLPTFVPIGFDWTRVCLGEHHGCGIRADGELHCWGDNTEGQLGVGDFGARHTPTRVEIASPIETVSCGERHTCAIDTEGRLHCWGDNYEGQVGLDDAFPGADVPRPELVAEAMRWRAVALGQGHSCAIRDDGILHCWGRNTDGQLGLGDGAPGQLRVPTPIAGSGAWTNVSVGQYYGCGIRDGELHCWGRDRFGELGIDASTGALETSPRRVGDANGWVEVTTGWFHACARTVDGDAHCWGRGIEGQLGLGTTDDRRAPARLEEGAFVELRAGRFSTCGRRDAGELYCWGENVRGQLGLGDTERRARPTPVFAP